MKRIKTFKQLFEAVKMAEDCEEFFRIAEGTRELEQIQTWYKLHPTRTGRINVTRNNDTHEYVNNPGSPYFYKSGGIWHFTFVATGKLYGIKSSSNLVELLKTFIRDIVYKFAPNDFNRKEAKEIVDDDALIFSKMWELPIDLYVAYRKEKRGDIITDFSLIKGKSKLIDRINSIQNIYMKGEYNGIEISLNSPIFRSFPNFLLDIGGAKEGGLGGHMIETDANKIEMMPKGVGKKVISSKKISRGDLPERREIKISLGYKTVDELVDEIEKIIMKEINGLSVYVGDTYSTINKKSAILTDFFRSYLLGSGTSREIEEILDDYMKKNPLDLHLLDDHPEYKAGVLRRTGIKDYSSIGRKLKQGLI
jgi:hypothetical protein